MKIFTILWGFPPLTLFIVSVWTGLSFPTVSRDETVSLSVDIGSLIVNSEGFFSSERKIQLREIRLFRNHRRQVHHRLRGSQVLVYIEIATVNGTVLVGESSSDIDYSGAVKRLNNYLDFWREQGVVAEPWKPLYEALMASKNMTAKLSEGLVLDGGIELAQSPNLQFSSSHKSGFSCVFKRGKITLPFGFSVHLWREKWAFCNDSDDARKSIPVLRRVTQLIQDKFCPETIVSLSRFRPHTLRGPYLPNHFFCSNEHIGTVNVEKVFVNFNFLPYSKMGIQKSAVQWIRQI